MKKSKLAHCPKCKSPLFYVRGFSRNKKYVIYECCNCSEIYYDKEPEKVINV